MIRSLLLLVCVSPLTAQTLLERSATSRILSTDVKVTIDGDMTLPGAKTRLTVAGESHLAYDERSLAKVDDAQRLLRVYTTVDIRRTVGDKKQTADIRPAARRMIVLRNNGVKSPFSPDGPLTWNELDVVKNDVFAPALANGLLPNKLVNPGDAWLADSDAIRELTDLEKTTEGQLKVTFAGVVDLDGVKKAKLTFAGTLRGVDDNGPARHTLDGVAYFDLANNYLSDVIVKGSHELLDGEGRSNGRIDGRFVLTRKLKTNDAMSDAAIAKLELKPTPDNSRLLYVNDDMGVKFTHSRRWRVNAVQGKQITLNGPGGAGMLITVEDKKTLPTPADFQKESLDFIRKGGGKTSDLSKIERLRTGPDVDVFHFNAELEKEPLQMRYAVVAGVKKGATIAARLPEKNAKDLSTDVDGVLREFELP